MEEMSKAQRRELLERVRLLAHVRLEENHSEEEVADKLGFGSVDALYQLTQWGLPDWLVHREFPQRKPGEVGDGKTARKVRTTGEALELPPAEEAVEVLRRELWRSRDAEGEKDWWRGSLEDDVEELHRLKEWLQGDLFVSVLYDEEDRGLYSREELPEEVWNSLCEEQGLDPETADAVEGPTSPSPLGASPMPWPGWVPLIAVYALRNPSVAPLLDMLHPDPSSVNVADLYKRRGVDGAKDDGTVTALRNAAERLAKVVRGWRVHRGAPP